MKNKISCVIVILLVTSACSGNKPGSEPPKSHPLQSKEPVEMPHATVPESPTEKTMPQLGIGVVGIKFNDKTKIRFYNEPVETNPVKVIRFFDDKANNCWNIADLEQQEKWLKPEVLWLDYYYFFMRCTERKGNWFKVIVNNESGKSYWIKKDSQRSFSDWKTFLSGMFGVERPPDHPQKIRTAPADDAPEIAYDGDDCFQVKSIQGDWIEISSADYCDDVQTPIQSGWIKWRNKDQLLITYFLTS